MLYLSNSYTPFDVTSYYTLHNIGVFVSVLPFSGQKGEKGRNSKSQNGVKQERSALSSHLLIDPCH